MRATRRGDDATSWSFGGNLPVGARLAVGRALVEVSDQAHRGCKKYAWRFGVDAFRFVRSETGLRLRARGLNARVVSSGVVRRGDVVRRLPQ